MSDGRDIDQTLIDYQVQDCYSLQIQVHVRLFNYPGFAWVVTDELYFHYILMDKGYIRAVRGVW